VWRNWRKPRKSQSGRPVAKAKIWSLDLPNMKQESKPLDHNVQWIFIKLPIPIPIILSNLRHFGTQHILLHVKLASMHYHHLLHQIQCACLQWFITYHKQKLGHTQISVSEVKVTKLKLWSVKTGFMALHWIGLLLLPWWKFASRVCALDKPSALCPPKLTCKNEYCLLVCIKILHLWFQFWFAW
jgi:hypothetical protein